MAASGVDSVNGAVQRQPIFDYHRDDIAAALRGAGLPVRADVGLSEFRVDLVLGDPSAPDEPLVAVLLDGPSWYSRRTVADRDGLPVDVLSGLLKWPAVERVWLPEWLQHRDATVARLRRAVADARERKVAPEPVAVEAERVVSVEPVAVASEPAVAEPREFAPLRSAPAAPVAAPAPRRHPMLQTYRGVDAGGRR